MQEKECTKQEVHFAEEAPTYYANFTGIAVGPYDVRFDFGFVNSLKSNPTKLELEKPVTVVMSKEFFLVLKDMIERAYEDMQKSQEEQQ